MELIRKDYTYREIQDKLKETFGSSISNSTIKKLHDKYKREVSKDAEIARLKKELALFKRLYFELLEKVEKSQKDKQNK